MTTFASDTALSAALDYAAAGVAVFPVRVRIQDGKKDVTPIKNWRDASTTDAATIQRWFTGSWAGASLAIDCGKSGLVVIDPDGADGVATWKALVGEHALPETWRTATPGGGEHWLYKADPAVRVGIDASGKVAPKVDVRGDGGFVITVPSADARGSYRWVEGAPEWAELPTVPGLVVDRMTVKPAHVAVSSAIPRVQVDDQRAQGWLNALVAGVIDDLSRTKGLRNQALNDAAIRLGHYVGAGVLDEREVRAKLAAACEANGYTAKDGLTAMERTLSSGLAAGIAVAASWPPKLPDRPLSGSAVTVDDVRRFIAAGDTDAAEIRSMIGAAAYGRLGVDELLAEAGMPGLARATAITPGGEADTLGSAATANEVDEPPRSSWSPINLDAVLDGTYMPPVPGLLHRSDGVGLFYGGLVHWVQGEPESGKSWVAQAAAARVLADGGQVLYIDHESDPGAIVARLLLLGTDRDALRSSFAYVQPEVSAERAAGAFAELCAGTYDLVVIDGVTDAIGTNGGSLMDNDEVAAWMRDVPRRLAKKTQAAVICIDHVVKGKDRGRFAIGAQAKMAGVDGAVYLVEPEQAMAPGRRGVLTLRIVKDRPGAVRAKCPAYRKEDRSQEAARVILDSTAGDRVTVTVEPPQTAATAAEGSWERPTEYMERASIALEQHDETTVTEGARALSTHRFKQLVRGKAQYVALAIEALVREGYVQREQIGNGFAHTLVRPYRQRDEAPE
jgi:hypothetical protein